MPRGTVVVCDLEGSTALAERLDPESLREVLHRYFDGVRAAFEAHGGRIEKVVGDAVVAVFGVDAPDGTDGAAPAVLAVGDALAALGTLNDRLAPRWGVRLVNRTGVATGGIEVASAAGDRIISGPAMDEAARLERLAPGLGALLSPATAALAATVARTEPGAGGARLLAEVLAGRPPAAPSGRTEDGGVTGRETRRTVTIVFADAVPEGEAAEAAGRDAAARWFALARGILERHGGTVERYIGDAVMAVFGLERRREDDALRAVLAAVEMRAALQGLNAELALAGAPPLVIRAGVNTGNLVAGSGADRQRLVTGDAVNVAARLQQAAGPGEVLAGDATVALTGGRVRGDTMEPLSVRGRDEPVPVVRVHSISEGRAGRRPETRAPLAGRDAELATLMDALAEAAGGRARLAVLAGDPGVGKSRLAEEFSARAAAAGALVLHGHCAAYGDGITFRPIVEVVREAAGIAAGDPAAVARELIAAAAGGDAAVSARLASLCGLSDIVHPLPELFWAVRRLLGRLAARRPVVVQVDDVHAAEPTLGELLVHLAEGDDARLLVLATARTDIRERRPEVVAAAGPRVVELGPLGPEAAAAMVTGMLDGAVPPAVVDRIVRAADGNPLFVEQLLSMMVGSGILERDGARWRVRGDIDRLAIPPSIEVLVATRVDALPEPARAALEAAAVVGTEFSADAVVMLAGTRDAVPLLDDLVARDLLQPADGAATHRFAHPMIRDVTYEGLLKRTRAALHERFAEWAERGAAPVAAAPEELGHHLERAHLYRVELGPPDPHVLDLGRRAAGHLGGAGRLALERGDMPAAANLLRRAAAALPADHGAAARLMVQAGRAQMETGRLDEAAATLGRAADRAATAGDRGLASVARIERTRLSYVTGGGPSDDEAAAIGEGAVHGFTATGDDEGLATAWRLLLNVRLTGSRFAQAERAATATLRHARAAGDHLLANRMQPVLALLSLRGPMPVHEALPRCASIIREVEGDRQAEAVARRALAHLRAMRGEVDAAREECRRCRDELEDLGWLMDAALVSLDSGPIALMGGDPAGAELELRRDLEVLDAMGERNYIATTSALLAEALYRQDRPEDAAEAAAFARDAASEGDVATHTILAGVTGKLLARAGDGAAAVDEARRAVALAETTDDPTATGDALMDLAEVLRLTGDREGTMSAWADARERYRTKGNLVALWRIARLVEELRRRR